MQDRAFANPKINFVWDSEPVEVLGQDKVTGVRIRSTKDGTEQVLPVTGVFVAIGHDPRSDLFAGQLATDPRRLPAGRPAVHAHRHRGRLRGRRRRRPHLPAGRHRRRHGCAAALDAERWLASKET